tara:strand:- start:251 stop:712 length:462 start_codon:yes stop_codon:yes gene_type:complete
MIKTFNFGKIDYNNKGRKINLVTLEVKFDGERFAVCGNVWNNKQTDIISGGQNLDDLYNYFNNNGLFLKIYSLWKQYHLNDLTPGTPKQMAFLSTLQKPINAEFYTWECEQLEKVDLLIDDLNGKPYKYGTLWLTNEIPCDVKGDINKLLEVA